MSECHSTHISHFRYESFQAIDPLVLTTKNKETKHYIYPKHKGDTEKKTALANRTIHTLVWYTFYDLQPGNGAGPIGAGPILTITEPIQGKL